MLVLVHQGEIVNKTIVNAFSKDFIVTCKQFIFYRKDRKYISKDIIMNKQYDIVKAYYPNKWMMCTGIQCFNWFLFSQPQYDEEYDLYYIILSKKAEFFSEDSGKSFMPARDNIKILLLNKPNIKKVKSPDPFKIIKQIGYDGFVKTIDCTSNDSICEDKLYFIKKGNLKQKYCGLVPHAIKFNGLYQEKFINFPTSEQILERLSFEGCEIISKDLYGLMK